MTETCANCGHTPHAHELHLMGKLCIGNITGNYPCKKFKPQNHSPQGKRSFRDISQPEDTQNHSPQENKEKLDLGVEVNEPCESSNTLGKQISTLEDKPSVNKAFKEGYDMGYEHRESEGTQKGCGKKVKDGFFCGEYKYFCKECSGAGE